MKTKIWAVGLILVCTLLTSSAQILYKIGSAKIEFNLFSLITNAPLILGLGLYAIGAILLIIALKGGDLNVLYPIIATSYIWVSLLSIVFLNESLNLFRWIGIFLIVVGVSFIGIGSKKDSISYTEAI